MITQPAKVFLPFFGLGVVAAVIFSALTGDGVGTTLFLAIAVAGFAAGCAVTVARENEVAPSFDADTAPAFHPLPATRLPGGWGWPALGGVGAGLLTLSLIVGPAFAIPGGALMVVAAAGWLGSIASDRTGRVANLMPIGIPVVGLFAIGSLMFFMSRILLAVPEQASTFVALGVAALILLVASLIAVKPALKPQTLLTALVVGGLLMMGGGLVAAAYGQRDVEHKGAETETVQVQAKSIKFLESQIELRAEQAATIKFNNGDPVPHNVAIYANADYTGQALFQGAVVTGPGSTEYHLTAPKAGTYYFRCDIHPVMQGKVVVS